MRKAVIILAIFAAAGAVFNLITIPLFHEEVFIRQYTIAPVEIIILLGFLAILIFNLMSLFWLVLQIHKESDSKTGHILLLIFTIFCIIGLMGQKVMLDEVANEYYLGWNVQGEWIIFLGLLSLQLVYCLVFLFTAIREKP